MFISVRSERDRELKPSPPVGGYEFNAFPFFPLLIRDINNGVQKYKKLVFLKILLSLIGQLFKEIKPETGEEP
jgi:hypothetical protein